MSCADDSQVQAAIPLHCLTGFVVCSDILHSDSEASPVIPSDTFGLDCISMLISGGLTDSQMMHRAPLSINIRDAIQMTSQHKQGQFITSVFIVWVNSC